MKLDLPQYPVTDKTRALLGFVIGLFIMLVVGNIFVVNSFDFGNMQRGISYILSGRNPWAADTLIDHFYNPPFAVLFLWPMLFVTPKIFLVLGGALLFAVVFYLRAWVALVWFATNTFLYLIAAGGIDMFVVGAGLVLLLIGDGDFDKWHGLFLRVIAYGIFLIKPQGTIFIVLLYILLRKDWKGLLISSVVYGLLFFPFYPDWVDVILHNPPLSQTEAAHTIFGKFGIGAAATIALLVLCARRWKYWQLGGALAGILVPYGMVGLPILLVLTGVRRWVAIPIVAIYSGLLALITWVSPPAGVEFYAYLNPLMSIYHLSMLGLALVLACMSGSTDAEDTIAVWEWIKQVALKLKPIKDLSIR